MELTVLLSPSEVNCNFGFGPGFARCRIPETMTPPVLRVPVGGFVVALILVTCNGSIFIFDSAASLFELAVKEDVGKGEGMEEEEEKEVVKEAGIGENTEDFKGATLLGIEEEEGEEEEVERNKGEGEGKENNDGIDSEGINDCAITGIIIFGS